MRKGGIMLRILGMAAAALACAGCMGVRWDPPETSGSAPDSVTALRGFEELLPRRVTMVTKVLFQRGWRRVTGSGFLDMSSSAGFVDLSVMKPDGTPLFRAVCSNGTTRCCIAEELYSRDPSAAESAALDVQRMYLDLVPPDGSESWTEGSTLIVRCERASLVTEWVFGSGSVLLEKRFLEDGKLVARAGYFDYTLENGRRVAHRVLLQNIRHRYGLTVSLEEIRMCE